MEDQIVETTTPEIISAPETVTPETPAVESQTSAAPEAPAWAPNYKIKAYDNEYEIPEKFRSFINQENEKDFREVFEKSYALETIKEKNARIRQMNETYEKKIKDEYEPLDKSVAKLGKYLEKGDYDSFFGTLNISEDKLQMWMLQKLQTKSLPPEQQEIYNRHSANQKQLYSIEDQAEAYRTELESLKAERYQAEVARTTMELESAISRPDVSKIAQQFDSRVGQPGSFKNEVIKRGVLAQQILKQNISVDQAVQEVINLIGPSAAPQTQATNSQVIQPQAVKPTLPNLAGKATSPAAQKITSLDDLKKFAAQQAQMGAS